MKKYYLFILPIFSVFLFNCKKEEPVTPCETEPTNINSDFELIWAKSSGTRFIDSKHVTVSNSSVIYSFDKGGTNYDEDLIAFDKNTGDTLWEYKSGVWYRTPQVYQDNYFVDIDGELVCINAATGNEVWRSNFGYLSHFIIERGSIYAAFGDKRTNSDSTQFYKITPSTGNGIELFSINKSERNHFSQNPKGMAVWQHPNGNEILAVHSDSYFSQVLNSRSEYYFIDLTGDSIYWDLGRYMVSGVVSNPIIDNYNIYFHTSLGEIAKLNLLNKTEVWKNENRPNSGSTKMILANSLLYKSVGSQIGELRIHNTFDGGIFKRLGSDAEFGTFFNKSTSNFRHVNNKLYFSSYNSVVVINLFSNQVENIILRSQKLDGLDTNEFSEALDVDPTTDYIYTEISGNIICIKEK